MTTFDAKGWAGLVVEALRGFDRPELSTADAERLQAIVYSADRVTLRAIAAARLRHASRLAVNVIVRGQS